jgi:S-adenosylmethionine-diacylgycerolhomoserine-N-methlytransferase
MSVVESRHAALMDGVYRRQRHIYDLTRKYFLLGRDRLIDGLDAGPGTAVLELGCGTGRNIVLAARRHRQARFFGLDISAEMLASAEAAIGREALGDRVALARGDATAFDPLALFGRPRFDRIFISYALSMIPDWERAIAAALAALEPAGSLHIVDFGQQERLPGWSRRLLRAWLAKFHVEPRALLEDVLRRDAAAAGRPLHFERLYRGYAWLAVVGPRANPGKVETGFPSGFAANQGTGAFSR